MQIEINGLGMFGFWLFMIFLIWIAHVQYMAGHDTLFFGHKSEQEKRIREAKIRELEMKSEKQQ